MSLLRKRFHGFCFRQQHLVLSALSGRQNLITNPVYGVCSFVPGGKGAKPLSPLRNSHDGERYKCRGILREWAEMPGKFISPEGELTPKGEK